MLRKNFPGRKGKRRKEAQERNTRSEEDRKQARKTAKKYDTSLARVKE